MMKKCNCPQKQVNVSKPIFKYIVKVLQGQMAVSPEADVDAIKYQFSENLK